MSLCITGTASLGYLANGESFYLWIGDKHCTAALRGASILEQRVEIDVAWLPPEIRERVWAIQSQFVAVLPPVDGATGHRPSDYEPPRDKAGRLV